MDAKIKIQTSDRDKDVYCVCMHGLLVGMHANFKPNVYRVDNLKYNGTLHIHVSVLCVLDKTSRSSHRNVIPGH